MIIVVVDTNVPVVANGPAQAPQVSPNCILACVQRIKAIMEGSVTVALDDQWRIIREYMRHLRSSGQPGVGDEFLHWVLINQANPVRCVLVHIAPSGPEATDFAEFPNDPALHAFDPADRKFVAVACAHPAHPPILQAADTKWRPFAYALSLHGVTVEFLCTEDLPSVSQNFERPLPHA